MSEHIILVDKDDNQVGLMEKYAVHRGKGRLHRAVSVLLYRRREHFELLLQQRSKTKPLWPLFWSNTVCTHPRTNEPPFDCAVRRLQEEMGISIRSTDLRFLFKLLYQARYNNEFSEHELDHVFVGPWDGLLQINTDEVNDAKWVAWEDVKKDAQKNHQNYTPWFKKLIVDDRVAASLSE